MLKLPVKDFMLLQEVHYDRIIKKPITFIKKKFSVLSS